MGRHRTRILGLLGLLLLIAALSGGYTASFPVRADHADGNMPRQVNYWLVEEGALRVCDNSRISLAHPKHTGRRNPAPP